MKFFTVAIAMLLGAASAVKCPGSSAWMHASCTVTLTTDADCSSAQNEMRARVNGQYNTWHDPHNNGTYTIVDDETNFFEMTRTTHDSKYTDKIDFTFEDNDSGCTISACSESQVTSVADFSTNYCNMRMMYCGDEDGCNPVTMDLGASETSVKPSLGASSKPSDCMQV